MEKKIIIVCMFFVLFAINCTKKINNVYEYSNKYFYKSKAEIINALDNIYITDTTSILIENNTLFAVFADYGSGEHLIEVNLFVDNRDRFIHVLCLRNINTSKVKFMNDELNKKLILVSKSEKELVSIPFKSLLLNQDFKYYDD